MSLKELAWIEKVKILIIGNRNRENSMNEKNIVFVSATSAVYKAT